MTLAPDPSGGYEKEACHANSKQMIARSKRHLRKVPIEEQR